MIIFVIIVLFLLILNIFVINSATYSQERTFINTNKNEWYIASSHGLNQAAPRIRMKFATDGTDNDVFTLFSIPILKNAVASGYVFTVKSNEILVRRGHSPTEDKLFKIKTDISFNDGKWHYIDVAIDINKIDVIIDNKKLPQIEDAENTLPISTTYVNLGGFMDGHSLTGKIKDIYFGDTQKTDLIRVGRI